jgi:hypothetical protein
MVYLFYIGDMQAKEKQWNYLEEILPEPSGTNVWMLTGSLYIAGKHDAYGVCQERG